MTLNALVDSFKTFCHNQKKCGTIKDIPSHTVQLPSILYITCSAPAGKMKDSFQKPVLLTCSADTDVRYMSTGINPLKPNVIILLHFEVHSANEA